MSNGFRNDGRWAVNSGFSPKNQQKISLIVPNENGDMTPSRAFSESLHFIRAEGKSQLSVQATEADLVSVEVCV